MIQLTRDTRPIYMQLSPSLICDARMRRRIKDHLGKPFAAYPFEAGRRMLRANLVAGAEGRLAGARMALRDGTSSADTVIAYAQMVIGQLRCDRTQWALAGGRLP